MLSHDRHFTICGADLVVVESAVRAAQVQVGIRPLFRVMDRDLGKFDKADCIQVRLQLAVVIELDRNGNHAFDHTMHHSGAVLLGHTSGFVDHQDHPCPNSVATLGQQDLGHFALSEVQLLPLHHGEFGFVGHGPNAVCRFSRAGGSSRRFLVDRHSECCYQVRQSAVPAS